MGSDTPTGDPPIKVSSTPSSTVTFGNDVPAPNATESGSVAATASGHMNPPPSQPLLEGGSGVGGSGMEMTSIEEEQERDPGA